MTTICYTLFPPRYAALESRDLIACAPTGTGKTVAFQPPTLQHATFMSPDWRLPHVWGFDQTGQWC
jgi:hypothetical protein